MLPLLLHSLASLTDWLQPVPVEEDISHQLVAFLGLPLLGIRVQTFKVKWKNDFQLFSPYKKGLECQALWTLLSMSKSPVR